ncbi:hypothetical protein [Deinococcus xianganensis]|uniref:Guanylate cyclase domain-containing protein n=1 Tax=Deinococcus xianganensis TaxID=1507289 RepID=A0A6I4YR07_9DEIO|nr:hypothetical protein [Deinococcus xianganensis]MXV20005.1 hypothetical protein [Deinococcus xianganensis]
MTTASSVEMTRSYVCYWDILGFTALISRGSIEEQNIILNKIKNAFSKAYQKVNRDNGLWTSRILTDNVVIVIKMTEEDDGESEIGLLLGMISEIQFELALEGYFIRGGIDYDYIYVDEEIIFGPALINAYKMESASLYPRIAFTEAAIEKLRTYHSYYGSPHSNPMRNMILLDNGDGIYFLNYMRGSYLPDMIEDHLSYYEDPKDYVIGPNDFPMIHHHRDVISENIKRYAKQPEVRRKYNWLANYHNKFCEIHGLPGSYGTGNDILSANFFE